MRPLSTAVLMAAVGCASSNTRPALPEVLPFIEDDYPRALADAKARQLPLFVDAWAPW